MSKLIRRVANEDLTKEEITNETEETETVQVVEPIVNEPIYTAGQPVDLTDASLGKIKLDCKKCHKILDIERHLGVNLCCPECGHDRFISYSNFRMESPDNTINIRVNDEVTRKGRMIWRVI